MKNPPTLADACIATALDKRVQPEVRDLLLPVASARKLVLDHNMSAFPSEGFSLFQKCIPQTKKFDKVGQSRLPFHTNNNTLLDRYSRLSWISQVGTAQTSQNTKFLTEPEFSSLPLKEHCALILRRI